MDDHSLFMWGEVPAFDSWPQVVSPSQPATLATSQQTYTIHERIKEKCQSSLLSLKVKQERSSENRVEQTSTFLSQKQWSKSRRK